MKTMTKEEFGAKFKAVFDKVILPKLPEKDIESRFILTTILLISHINNAIIHDDREDKR